MSTPTTEKFIRIDVWAADVFFKSKTGVQAPQGMPAKLVEEYLNQIYGSGNWIRSSLKKSSLKIKTSKLDSAFHVLSQRLKNLTEQEKIAIIERDVASGKYPLHVCFPHSAEEGKVVHIQVETQEFGRLDIRRTILRTTSEGRVVFNEGDVFDLDFFYSANQPHIRASAKIQIECEVYETTLPQGEHRERIR